MSAIRNDEFPAQAARLRDRLMIVQDVPSVCPYIESMTARTPLYYPTTAMDGREVDDLLAAGFRRSGGMVYYTKCAPCHACEPIRVDVPSFRWSGSFKRILKRAEKELTLAWRYPTVDPDRVRLYNEHRDGRSLGPSGSNGNNPPVDASDYESFLIDTCWPSLELEIKRDDQLIAISIMDVGQQSVSAVYTHFDPVVAKYSLGTLAVLQQIRWAEKYDRRWVYLGLYVASNPHLNYKSRFVPQQRLIGGTWVDR